jgi:8-oxo-dGTP pyrophosphatase MutT (NUDIX family)
VVKAVLACFRCRRCFPPRSDPTCEVQTLQTCDHTSVGLLVWRDGRLLLIERKRPPFGFAAPAGHVDDHGSFEDAARAELDEEVGLDSKKLTLIREGRKNNKCRRPEGDWHFWRIYTPETSGTLRPSLYETKSFLWADNRMLRELAERTKQYISGDIEQEAWEQQPGLEPVWYEWLSEIGVLDPKTKG